jgi:hypothetical protein
MTGHGKTFNAISQELQAGKQHPARNERAIRTVTDQAISTNDVVWVGGERAHDRRNE